MSTPSPVKSQTSMWRRDKEPQKVHSKANVNQNNSGNKTLYDFAYFKPQSSITEADPEVWGHIPEQIDTTRTFRILLQNPNGIRPSVTEPEFLFSLHICHEIGAGAICLAETINFLYADVCTGIGKHPDFNHQFLQKNSWVTTNQEVLLQLLQIVGPLVL
jgi:hypothetical protein